MKTLTLASGTVLLLFLAACSEAPRKTEEKKAEAAKPAEPVTGRTALQKMFVAGRGWAADIEILKLNSIQLPDVKQERGKAAAWQVVFVSRQRSKARTYTYSVVEAPGNLHQGVFSGLDEGWSGAGPTKPFLMAAVKVDSDAAYETALTKAAAYEKKNPGKNIAFLLESTRKYPDPTWRVIWGESVGTSNFSILVDASTGAYLETMR